MPGRAELDPDSLIRALQALPGWQLVRDEATGNSELRKEFAFPSFAAAVAFMHAAVPEIDQLDHHPRWENRYRQLTVWTTTWDCNHRLTAQDIALAQLLDRRFSALGGATTE